MVSPCTSRAVFGVTAPSASMAWRARPAAIPSSSSPTAKRKTTSAPSACAPMSSAPSAAIETRALMSNGLPVRAAPHALRATGTTASRVAAA